jgi:anti-sigma factor RsiW
MSCSPSDLKDLFFGELTAEQRRCVEQHVATCSGCRDELNSLTATRGALLSVSDEEPPRRIAFVSDKVFEPRWWQRIWSSGPQLGFVSSCVLAMAILAHALYTPASPVAPPVAPVAALIDESAIEAAVAKRLDAAIQKAVADSEVRQSAKLLEFVNTKLRRSDRQYELLVDYIERMDKRVASYRRTALYEPVEVR